jgi:hypothetical protein
MISLSVLNYLDYLPAAVALEDGAVRPDLMRDFTIILRVMKN